MDEAKPDIKKGDKLPGTDEVYRIVLNSERDRRNKAIPAIRCFMLNKNDKNKLSVDWNKRTTPEETIARVGATFRYGKNEYKPYKNREIYALDIDYVCSLDDIKSVIYDPIELEGNPKGRVKNPAHSLIVFNDYFSNLASKETEVYFKLRQHAKDRLVSVDMEEVGNLVQEYREKQE